MAEADKHAAGGFMRRPNWDSAAAAYAKAGVGGAWGLGWETRLTHGLFVRSVPGEEGERQGLRRVQEGCPRVRATWAGVPGSEAR